MSSLPSSPFVHRLLTKGEDGRERYNAVELEAAACFAEAIDDANVEMVGMQVDAAVEFMLLMIQLHNESPWVRVKVLSQQETYRTSVA